MLHLRRNLSAIVTAIVLGAGPVRAVDGVTEINQTSNLTAFAAVGGLIVTAPDAKIPHTRITGNGAG